MRTVGDFYNVLDEIAPFATAESWDNVGLVVGGRTQPVHRVLLALDLTGAVLDEAVQLKADLVITHHPLIFHPLRRISQESLAYRTVAAGIAVISAHTNLDVAQGGVNDALAQCLGLQQIRPFRLQQGHPAFQVTVFVPVDSVQPVLDAMAEAGAGQLGQYAHCAFQSRGEGCFLPLDGSQPAIGRPGRLTSVEEVRLEMICAPSRLTAVLAAMTKAHPYEQPAYDVAHNYGVMHHLSLGRIGDLKEPMSPSSLAVLVKEQLGAAGVRYVDGGRKIASVGVCGGSGADLLTDAHRLGVQALVTSEAKHNHLLEASELGITLIDAGHFATENVAMEPLKTLLMDQLPDVEILLSQCCTDGVRYLA